MLCAAWSESSKMNKKVLVVEDDLLNRMFLSDSLRAQGFTVREVDDGAQVMDAAREFEPHLVTMDINIPHISGETLIRRLRRDALLHDVPVLAITAYAARQDEDRIRKAGASGYLSKPIALKPFLDSVHGLLSDAAAQG